MKRNSADLYPMRVNPFNFSHGDVVKKIITDKIQTPYTGIVIAVVPTTNKVIVQWPNGEGYEDPWDLIKINPFIHPPVVKEDKSYPSFQNELSHRYFEKIKPHRVLEDYLKEEVNPILLHLSKLYNDGYSKAAAYNSVIRDFDNKSIIQSCIEKIYSDEVNIKYAKDVYLEGNKNICSIKLSGNNDSGFILETVIDDNKNYYHYSSIINAVEDFNNYKKILSSYNEDNYENIVKKVSKELRNKSI